VHLDYGTDETPQRNSTEQCENEGTNHLKGVITVMNLDIERGFNWKESEYIKRRPVSSASACLDFESSENSAEEHESTNNLEGVIVVLNLEIERTLISSEWKLIRQAWSRDFNQGAWLQ
jgi:hypothetical protein